MKKFIISLFLIGVIVSSLVIFSDTLIQNNYQSKNTNVCNNTSQIVDEIHILEGLLLDETITKGEEAQLSERIKELTKHVKCCEG